MTRTRNRFAGAILLGGLAFALAHTSPAYAQDATPAKASGKETAQVSETPPSPPAPGEVEPSELKTTVVVRSGGPISEKITVVDSSRDKFGRKKGFAPALSFGLQAGINYWTEDTPFFGTAISIGRATVIGPSVGFRTSFEFFSWLALDARLLYSNNKANDLVNGGSLTDVGGLGAVRFTLPLFALRPYVLAGFGGHRIFAGGPGTELVDDHVPAPEVGIGAFVPLDRHFDVGAEYEYSHLLGEVLSTNPKADGGDPSYFSLFATYRFEI